MRNRVRDTLAAKRAAKRGVARKGRKVAGKKVEAMKGFSVQQTVSILKALGRNQETKYIATPLCSNQSIDGPIHTISSGPGSAGDWFPLVPKIPQGTSESQRIGNTVAPYKCYVDVFAGFNQQLSEAGVPAVITPSQVYVHIFLLRPKQFKNWTDFAQAGTALAPPWLTLMDAGNGTSTLFGHTVSTGLVTSVSDAQRRVDTNNFTLVKKKVVKLTRNLGAMQGAASVGGESPNLPSSTYSGRFYYNLPKLHFDDSNQLAGGYPTNSAMGIAFGYVVGDENNSVIGNNLVTLTLTQHIMYKDG